MCLDCQICVCNSLTGAQAKFEVNLKEKIDSVNNTYKKLYLFVLILK